MVGVVVVVVVAMVVMMVAVWGGVRLTGQVEMASNHSNHSSDKSSDTATQPDTQARPAIV